MDQDRVLKLIELIYDAAADPSGWAVVLTSLVGVTGGTGADLVVHSFDSGATSIQAGVGTMTAEFQRDYQAVADIDPFLIRGRELQVLKTGLVGIGEHVVPLRELERTEFYHSFGRRHEYIGGLAAIIAADRHSMAAIGISRRRKREFGHYEVRLMRTLLPHLQRAVHLHRRLTEADRHSASLAEAIDRFNVGVLILGEGGAVQFANLPARTILAARDGLVLDRGALRAAGSRGTSALNKFIATALAAARSNALDGGGALQLDRPSGRRPLRLVISPLPVSEPLASLEPRALVFVADSHPQAAPDTDILRQAFGLTPAEAEVAALLVQDKSVREISEWLGVSTHTIRFHLKQLFAKTETRRQSELMRLLAATALLRRT